MEVELKRMAGGGVLALNLCMYIIMSAIAGWALNQAMDYELLGDMGVALPVPFWSLYFPMGNAATGYFVIFSLIAGMVGASSCILGMNSLRSMAAPALAAAASSATTAWSLTLLAMGLACKEINLHGRNSRLKTLESFSIILTVTHFVGLLAILSLNGTIRMP